MSRLNSLLTVYTTLLYFRQMQYDKHADDILFTEKAKQRCVMGVGMCLYAQLMQTKNKQCKSAIVLQCYVSVVSADITVCGKLFQIFTILGAKENFLKS